MECQVCGRKLYWFRYWGRLTKMFSEKLCRLHWYEFLMNKAIEKDDYENYLYWKKEIKTIKKLRKHTQSKQ